MTLRTVQDDVTNEARNFCSRQGVTQYLPIAIELIESCFPSMQECRMAPEQDPDTGEEWLSIDITVSGDVGDVLECDEKFIEQYVSSVPWPERDKIRLSYDIV